MDWVACRVFCARMTTHAEVHAWGLGTAKANKCVALFAVLQFTHVQSQCSGRPRSDKITAGPQLALEIVTSYASSLDCGSVNPCIEGLASSWLSCQVFSTKISASGVERLV